MVNPVGLTHEEFEDCFLKELAVFIKAHSKKNVAVENTRQVCDKTPDKRPTERFKPLDHVMTDDNVLAVIQAYYLNEVLGLHCGPSESAICLTENQRKSFLSRAEGLGGHFFSADERTGLYSKAARMSGFPEGLETTTHMERENICTLNPRRDCCHFLVP